MFGRVCCVLLRHLLLRSQSIPSRLVELVGFVTTSRLCGELSVSRAFGDIEYKGALKNEYWGRSFTNVRNSTCAQASDDATQPMTHDTHTRHNHG